MSKKYSNTTSDYLSWDQNLNLIRRLFDDDDFKMSLLISMGSFWGLRISDLLNLKWVDVLGKDNFVLVEKKTNKSREIKINDQLQRHIADCHTQIKPHGLEGHIFLSQKGTIFSIQRINIIFKTLKGRYNLNVQNFSTHSMRKTFGREIFTKSGVNAELAIVKLSQIFNHSNPAVTRRYLGISQEELKQTYDVLSF